MENGFFRVAAVAPSVNVADCDYNTDCIIAECNKLYARHVRLAVFPEMSITGYTCADLFHSSVLLDAVESGLKRIIEASCDWNMTVVVGAPVSVNNNLYNCAIVIYDGHIIGAVPKIYVPEYNEFYEKRWWKSGCGINCTTEIAGQSVPFGAQLIFKLGNVAFAAEICEDLWSPIPPSTYAAMAGAQIILNLSASNDLAGKYTYLKSLITQQSARCLSAYVYAGAGYGESSTDAVFDGKAVIAENGAILSEADRWTQAAKTVISDIDIDALNRDRMHINTFNDCAAYEGVTSEYVTIIADDKDLHHSDNDELLRDVNPLPFVPATDSDARCDEIINIQVAGLMRRLDATHTRSLVVGISGGLDSTLALLVAVEAFNRLGLPAEGILAVTMPGFGTTSRTCNNAKSLMQRLGVSMKEISIVPAVTQHFNDIEHDVNCHDVTFENSQARERTQILMDLANKSGGMVLGTGDLSELALGWATYNGDHMSMYGVNAGVPKTLVSRLVKRFAMRSEDKILHDTLIDIIDTPISPELIPADEHGNIKQKTEDLVGPYQLHDFFLYYVLRYGYSPRKIFYLAHHAFKGEFGDDVIKHWLRTFFRRFFTQQFKRSCMPDGPKVGSVCLSPRGDWRMPSDASSALWLKECDTL